MTRTAATRSQPVPNPVDTTAPDDDGSITKAVGVGLQFLTTYNDADRGKRAFEMYDAILGLAQRALDNEAGGPDRFHFSPEEVHRGVRGGGQAGGDPARQVRTWWKSLEDVQEKIQTGLEDLAREQQVEVIPWIERISSKGGPGQTALYQVCARRVGQAPNEFPHALPEGGIRYRRESLRKLSPRLRTSYAIRLIGVPLRSRRANLMIAVALPLVLFAAWMMFTALLGLTAGHPVRAVQPLSTGGLAAVILYLWLGNIARTADHGVVMASDALQPFNDHEQMQLVREYVDNVAVLRVTKFVSECSVPGCDGRVLVK